MPVAWLHKSLYKWAWDTRCRNRDVAAILRPLIGNESTILDAGCGEFGLAAFVSAKHLVGVDVIPSIQKTPNFTFIYGSITALPFAERSFSVAASVDVLEHLPKSVRVAAVRQLVMAADKVILITFPSGKTARAIDEAFEHKLAELSKPIPAWLSEHLQNDYPVTSEVLDEIDREAIKRGREVRTSVFYSEDVSAGKFLRGSAARSRYLYMASNLLLGLLLPVFPRVPNERAYRSIILAEFVND